MFQKILNNMLDRYSAKRFKKMDEWFSIQLNSIQLTPPLFYKPSADAELLVRWESIFKANNMRCVNSAPFKNRSKYLSDFFADSVIDSTVVDDEFNWGNIDSLTASKGFGQNHSGMINGSWFPDLNSWGAAMYPTHNETEYISYGHHKLAALSADDWENNLRHIQMEGFDDAFIRVVQYQWLCRNVCLNSGGSHHAAMLVHQIKNYGYSYTQRALVTKYSLDIAPIEKLISGGYFIFITSSSAFDLSQSLISEPFEFILNNRIANEIYCYPMNGCSSNGATVYIMHRDAIQIPIDIFESWYQGQVDVGRIIPLLSMLKDTLAFCTHPYLHELSQIHLGDPFRRSDKALRHFLKG
ncbi:DUF6685 family protein [Vibrio splendidus]|uniref:Uncharacterized protein n=1 Tax=Vibrio splendidus TaxID=29497 RepID=A0A2T5EJT2_VIBSP|nr:DUF6685 family protein [Vibrio splendidus]EHY9845490.1 hypothetical protein [Vibrio cholerae]OEE59629.1 hypothetical protein A147_00520 [Vibrio splendidus FF-6]PTP20514.1 hypothetical protein CWO36_08300 [Vibrio splendidus]